MFSRTNSAAQSAEPDVAAIKRSQTVFKFDVDGSIVIEALRGPSSQVGALRADTKVLQ